MSEQALQRIMDGIQGLHDRFGKVEEDIGRLNAGQAELYQITAALKHGQELTHAKLEALTLDVRRLEGTVARSAIEREAETTELRGDIRFLNQRIANVEMEVDRLKNR
ncbi:hypothetical protein [Cohnella sp. GCM10027633]|uniref:hypothetical protein n=1 Tax=unclassified Cohnella TaxID=2636738 RepID=UPI0036329017